MSITPCGISRAGRLAAVAAALVGGLTSCSDQLRNRVLVMSPTQPVLDVFPATLTPLDGEFQWGKLGDTLPKPVRFIVRDGGKRPLANMPVRFSLWWGGTISDTLVQTDANGIATLRRWQLGRTPGMQAVFARLLTLRTAVHAIAEWEKPAHPLRGLLFLRNDTLWQTEIGGQPTVALHVSQAGSQARLSPDGLQLAMSYYGSGRQFLCIVKLAAADRQCIPVTDPEASASLDFAWSRDGSTLFLFAPRASFNHDWFVAALDVATMAVRPLLSRTDNGAEFDGGTMSPDGASLTLAINGTLWRLPLRNSPGAAEEPTIEPILAFASLTNVSSILWSPDGRTLAVKTATEDEQRIVLYNADGSRRGQIEWMPTLEGGGYLSLDRWAPDGGSLITTRAECVDHENCESVVLLHPRAGGAPREIGRNMSVQEWR